MSETPFDPRVTQIMRASDIPKSPERHDPEEDPRPFTLQKGYIRFGEEAQLDTSYPLNPNSSQLNAVLWYTFGRRSCFATKPVLKANWERRASFQNPVTTDWQISLPTMQTTMRLLHGYRGQTMDDRWFIYADGPVLSSSTDGDGTCDAKVHLHRNWTGYKVAELKLRLSHPESATWMGEITSMMYEGDLALEVDGDEKGIDTPEDLAKFLVVQACSHALGVDLVSPGEVQSPKGWQGLENEIFKPWSGGSMYRASVMSAETEEDWHRLGSDPSIIRLS